MIAFRLPATDYRPSDLAPREGEGLLAWLGRTGEVRGFEDLDRRWPWCERCGEAADGIWRGRKLCAKCVCAAEVAELSGQFVRAIRREPEEATSPWAWGAAVLACGLIWLAVWVLT